VVCSPAFTIAGAQTTEVVLVAIETERAKLPVEAVLLESPGYDADTLVLPVPVATTSTEHELAL
jgi:hypothetical protein